MKVLFLFNNPIGRVFEGLEQGVTHDNHLYGMLRLRKRGFETEHLEIERFVSPGVAAWLRKHVLTMHYVHLPLFPLFFRYDVVLTSTAYGYLMLKSLLRIKRFKWVLLDFNVLGTIGAETSVRERLFAWAVSRVDGIVTISAAEAEALKVRFPHLAPHITFIHEGTDTTFFSPDTSVEETNSVVSVGMYGRDFETLIDATKGLGVRCVLATKLISLEAAAKLPEHVSVGVYDHSALRRVCREAKIAYVGISKPDTHYDSVGTFAVIEAMSMGKAVVATHMKSMESYIIDGETGRFVPHHDVAALRSVLTELLTDDAKRRLLGTRAREWALEHVDAEVFAGQLAVYLKSLS